MSKKITTKPGPKASRVRKASSKPLPKPEPRTKSDQVVELLRRSSGASLSELMNSTGWQAHSIRGFLSGTLGKRRGLRVARDVVDGERRYRIVQAEAQS